MNEIELLKCQIEAYRNAFNDVYKMVKDINYRLNVLENNMRVLEKTIYDTDSINK